MAQEAANISNVANVLRSARRQQKLSVDAVAKEICVRGRYLSAIEEGRYSDLPGKTFAIGFVKSYAKMLKLDQNALSEKFKSEYAEQLNLEVSGSSVDKPSGGRGTVVTDNTSRHSGADRKSIGDHSIQMVAPKERRWPAWISPVVGLAGAGMSWFLIGSTSTVSSVAVIDTVVEERTLAAFASAAPSELPDSRARGATGLVIEEATTDISLAKLETDASGTQNPEISVSGFATGSLFTPSVHAANHVPSGLPSPAITFEALEDSWVQLSYRDGTELWSGVLRAGQSYRPQLIGEVFLTTSNAGGIILKQSDAALGPLGKRGLVIESMALDASIFEAETFSDAMLSGSVIGGSE